MATLPKVHVRGRESEAIKFLRITIAPGGYGTVVAINPKSGHCIGCSYTHDDVRAARQFIAQHADAHYNLYLSPNPTRNAINKKPLKCDIAEMFYAHLDYDDPSDAALQRLRDYPLPPTIIVFSGGGYNAYWRLNEPIRANGNIAMLEGANKKLIADFGGDVGTHNIDRILRLPGTVNYPNETKKKRGRVPIEARLIDYVPERTYKLADFQAIRVEQPSKRKPGKTVTQANDRSRDLLGSVAKAVRDGMSDAEIHEALDAHPHAADQSDPGRSVDRCISKIRTEQTGIVASINEKNALVFVSGKLVVMWPQVFEDGLPRLSNVTDVRYFWRTHQRGRTSPVDIWLRSSSRREFSGFCFRPGGGEVGDLFNLFRGWGVEPDPDGDCSRFLEHLKEVICAGDQDVHDYVLQWFANAVQKPEDKPGTCLAIRSGQGAGKGLLARYIGPIFGPHMSRLAGSEQLLGRFNDTLAGKLMVFGDEAAWPGDQRGIDKLKSYITEERITVERKHVPAVEIDNHARFIFATNRDHSAPVEIDDRRFVVLNASDAHVGDERYWGRIEAERKGTGPAALLHFLLNLKLVRNLRITPKTAALAEQKLMSLDDVGGFARELLMRQKHRLDLGFNAETGGHMFVELAFGEITGTVRLHQFYLEYCRRNAIRYTKNMDALGIGLRKYFHLIKREARKDERKRLGLEKRARVYALPSLDDARTEFAAALRQPVEWLNSTSSSTFGAGKQQGSGAANA